MVILDDSDISYNKLKTFENFIRPEEEDNRFSNELDFLDHVLDEKFALYVAGVYSLERK
eukprot:CAMPEP_0204833682 /NCGR_PEP_ID=MMETSP1346-20131115/17445_1 /ASSEMBLY_ACC=CAM_ASM_000771 /TAXON_ID=215587 /ORGANISM="Aplanochytrium stocchinoi, Strain GSBS06" /LENGTH=58 /DNA_ID=CAMNT_0051966375 /DNA_START=46 /DNA_END=225 /DNA_ORIENTATION=+